MKGNVINMLLIMIVIVLLTSIVAGWTIMNTIGFFEMNEINAVKHEFEECNDKILETARTGISNKCIFSADRGQVKGTKYEISYQVLSRVKICDKTDWVLLKPEKNLWQRCDVSGREVIFGLKWNSTNIKFGFEKTGKTEIIGETGRIVEMSREGMSDDEIDLLLRIQ